MYFFISTFLRHHSEELRAVGKKGDEVDLDKYGKKRRVSRSRLSSSPQLQRGQNLGINDSQKLSSQFFVKHVSQLSLYIEHLENYIFLCIPGNNFIWKKII